MNKRLIAPIASALAIFGFFMPWMSCGMMTFTGMDLASGNMSGGMGDLGAATGGSDGGEPLLFIVLLAAVAIIGLYFMYQKRNRLAAAIVPTIVASVIAIGIMTWQYIKVQDLKSEMNSSMDGLNSLSSDTSEEESTESESMGDLGAAMGGMISIKWGFWLSAFGFITCIYGATQYRDLPKPPEDVAATAPPYAGEPPVAPSDEISNIPQDRGMT